MQVAKLQFKSNVVKDHVIGDVLDTQQGGYRYVKYMLWANRCGMKRNHVIV
jgi:hypothetical protein